MRIPWRKLWEEFSDVLVNDNDEIEEDFLLFEAGTDRLEIWHWFEDEFSIILGNEIYK